MFWFLVNENLVFIRGGLIINNDNNTDAATTTNTTIGIGIGIGMIFIGDKNNNNHIILNMQLKVQGELVVFCFEV